MNTGVQILVRVPAFHVLTVPCKQRPCYALATPGSQDYFLLQEAMGMSILNLSGPQDLSSKLEIMPQQVSIVGKRVRLHSGLRRTLSF